MTAHEVVLLLESDHVRGLSEAEARHRRDLYGPNQLPGTAVAGPARRFLNQFQHPLVYVLLGAGAIALALGRLVDASVIIGVVLVNTVTGFLQESKAYAALDALRSMVRTEARVVREGRERKLPSEELVPGDIVRVQAGDRVPADLRLVRVDELRVDESSLTGESVPVAKDEVVLPPGTPVADRRNMVYSGTLVTGGSGTGITVATGGETELGEIHRLVATAEPLETPLTRKLAWFSRLLTVVILALALATLAIGVLRGESAVEMFIAAIALAVAIIPEGLPAVVTIVLAIGMSRMARRRAVIRRLPAVETLGSTTVICSDKTGTLTENAMTVRVLWTPDRTYSVTGVGYSTAGEVCDERGQPVDVSASQALVWSLLAGAGCNDASLKHDDGRTSVLGDPTEVALLVAATKGGYSPEQVARRLPREATIPFSSERRYMATLHEDRESGGYVVLVKGAVERILSICTGQMSADGTARRLSHQQVLHTAEHLGREGLRVLAIAMGRVDDPRRFDEDLLPDVLLLTGLVGMFDPPRPAVPAAVASCHAAGIAVKMVTGDQATTAAAVAARIGLTGDREGAVLTGPELASIPYEEQASAVERALVFARMSPDQKLDLVKALQSRGHIVAVTGDGVNDASALRQADIGVAMGQSGTEVARDAADMVLLDDDFATIEAAVEEGRAVFDNLMKYLVWTLPTNLGQGMVILVVILLGLSLPVLPTQILWINMTTAVFLGLMLAFEPKEAGIMRRPPRSPTQPLLTIGLGLRTLLVAVLIVGGVLWVFSWEQRHGATLEQARTAAVGLVIAVETGYLLSCRSLTRSIWQVGVFSNPWIIVGISLQVIAQAGITYLPAMNVIFETAPLPLSSWLRIVVVALVVAVVVTADKTIRRRAPLA